MYLFVLLLTAPAVQAQEWLARARVDSTEFRVGDRINVRVDLIHPPGAVIRSDVPDTLDKYQVIERHPLQDITDTLTTGLYVVARYDSGTALLPPLRFSGSAPGDSVRKTVATNPLLLTVTTVPVDTSQDIRDLKPPLSVPLTLQEILLYGGILLAAVVLLYFGYRYWKKRRTRAAGEAYAPPPRPAHLIAFEQLAKLKEKKLWQQGHIKEYYTEVTDILRGYFEARYTMMALEETTDEIITGLARLRFPEKMLADTERILRRADLVKFAKVHPDISEHEEIFTVVHEIVDKTKIVAMTPVAGSEAKAVTHAGV